MIKIKKIKYTKNKKKNKCLMNKEDVGKLIFEKNINFKKIIKFQKNDKFCEILLKKQIIRVILKIAL